MSALYGAGKKTSFWSLSDGQIARTEWVRGSVLQPEEPVGIYLQAEGDGKRGGVIVYYEGKDIQTCIEWNKTHGNLAQWKASIAEQKAKPVLATQQEQHPNLPIGYKGDSIADLVSKLEEIDKAAIDEFTKKSEVNKRYAQLRSRPYRFVFDVQANHSALYPSLTKYDAESEQLNVVMSVRAELLGLLHSKHYLVIKLAGDATVSHYLGQNAFGASAKIKKIDTEGFGIALTNGINVDATSNLALLSLAIPMHPQEAKAIKADISYFVDVDLPENNSLTNVLTSSSHSKATINDPTEIVSNYKYIPARLIKVGAFRRSTGEVVGWRAFN